MKYDRRNFLRSASLLSTCTITELNVVAAMQQLPAKDRNIRGDDEIYWKNVRQLFPLSNEWAYLNNGTMGPSPYPVIEAIQKGIMQNDEQGDYGDYEQYLEAIAPFVGAHKNEIALTHNVTEGSNIVCWGLPLRKSDEVIMTDQEHVGGVMPWLNRQKLHGIVLKTFTPAPTAEETLERIASIITKKTRVIAIPHMPCTQGQVMPVKEICRLARDKGIYSCIDGAHGPGMMPVNLHDMGCDTYASCCHKWMLGPKGTGFLYVRAGFGSVLQPYFVGGGSTADQWDMANNPGYMPPYADTAHRYFGGTQSLAFSEGVKASVGFMDSIGIDNTYARVMYLSSYLQQELLAIGNAIELLTPTEEISYAGINSFRIKGVEIEDFFRQCYKKKIRVRTVTENGMNCIRISTHVYNNKDEIDALIGEIKIAMQ